MYFCIFIYLCTHTDRETVKFRMYIIIINIINNINNIFN